MFTKQVALAVSVLLPAIHLARASDPEAKVSHVTLPLDGAWTITPLPLDATYQSFLDANAERIPAQVPGDVHLDLMRAGRMEDPDVGDNARTRCRWPESNSWWYVREFVVPPEFIQRDRQSLEFDGIDLYSQIFLNSNLVGSSKDAMSSFAFDVKGQLRAGTNQLVVRVTSGTELFAPGNWNVKTNGGLYDIRDLMERRAVRKPPFIYGWDWCDPLPNIGLWRNVRLEGRNKVAIRRVRLDTVIKDKDVVLEGEVALDNLDLWAERNCVLELRVDPPDGKSILQRYSINLEIGHGSVHCRIPIPNPQLWWPNGMGSQPLYRLTARVLCDNEETDSRAQTIGLRTIQLDRSPLSDGDRFCFKVNGRDVFCRGGNWAPPDLIAARIAPARYQELVNDAKEAHFTMFRVNGAGSYPGDPFFDACDRAGILVWQDFTYACNTYPDRDPEFMALSQQETETLVDRLHPHPSMALWCGCNECLWQMADSVGNKPPTADQLAGSRIWRDTIPDVCHAEDPGLPYIPGSPVGGAYPNSESAGDCHWWYQVFLSGDGNTRVQPAGIDACRARFVSEYGVIAPPDLGSVNEYLKPDDRNRESVPWKIHSNMFEKGWVAKGIRYHYGNPDGLSLPQFILYGQLVQALMHGAAMDAFRFRKLDPRADCEGALIWSYNDCWGETGWAVVDHYLRPKAAYYALKRSCAPVKVIVRSRDHQLMTRVVNDTLQTCHASVRYGWFRLDGSAQELKEAAVVVPADGMIEVARTPIPSPEERDPHQWLYAAVMRGSDVDEDQSIWLLAPERELALAQPVLSTKLLSDGALGVSSSVYCHAVHLDDDGAQTLTDNYFDLLPGIPRHIRITKPVPAGEYPLAAVLPISQN